MNIQERNAALAALKSLSNSTDALFRPSAAARWMICQGSIQLTARAPKEQRSSDYAKEGTAAHVVGAAALKGERQPDEWTDRQVRLDDKGMEGWFVDEEMVTCMEGYVDDVESRRSPGSVLYVEHKLSLSPLNPGDPLLRENTGTGDCVILDPVKRRLTIEDLKYGKGVMVAGDSKQLKDYALMGLLTFMPPDGGWKEVETVVYQPRASRESERIKAVLHDPYTLTMDFIGELITAMETALQPDAPLVTGEHCRWCPAAAICPALRTQAIDLARDTFAAIPMINASSAMPPLPQHVFVGTLEEPKPKFITSGTVVLPPAPTLDPGEIATILARRPLWEAWITSIERRAVAMLEGGATVPGYKLVARSGHRKWKDAATAPDALRELGVVTAKMYTEPKLKSPAQIEKLLPVAKKPLIAALVERPELAPTLEEASTEKPALAPVMGAIPLEQR